MNRTNAPGKMVHNQWANILRLYNESIEFTRCSSTNLRSTKHCPYKMSMTHISHTIIIRNRRCSIRMNSNLIETASFPQRITTTYSKHIHIYIHTYMRALGSILSKHYYEVNIYYQVSFSIDPIFSYLKLFVMLKP